MTPTSWMAPKIMRSDEVLSAWASPAVRLPLLQAFAGGLALTLAVGPLTGCGDKSVVVAPSASAPPALIDQAAPGELLESTEVVSGIHLPEHMVILSHVGGRVLARGVLPFEDVSNYIRARVDAKVVVGPDETNFSDAIVKNNPESAKRPLKITVRREGKNTLLTIEPRPNGNYW